MKSHLFCNHDDSTPIFMEEKHFAAGLYTKKNPNGRGTNEDSMGIIEIGKDHTLVFVADEADGFPKTDEASKQVVHELEKSIKKSLEKKDDQQIRNIVLDSLERSNQKLIESPEGGKTTFLICEIQKDNIRTYQIGDCELFVCGMKGKEKYHSLSHSPVGYGLEGGFLNEEDALMHPERHLIFNLMGEEGMKIEIGPWIHLDPKDTVFIATDGVFDNMTTFEIIELVRSGNVVDSTYDLIRKIDDIRSDYPDFFKHDDLSFIIFRIGGAPKLGRSKTDIKASRTKSEIKSSSKTKTDTKSSSKSKSDPKSHKTRTEIKGKTKTDLRIGKTKVDTKIDPD